MRNLFLVWTIGILTTAALGVDVDSGKEQAKPGGKAGDVQKTVIDTSRLAQCGTWMVVTLDEDVRLEQRMWGAGEHHRQADFSVLVDEVIRGTGSAKPGDKLKISLNLIQQAINNEIGNGRKGNKFLLGVCESRLNGDEVSVDHWGGAGNVMLSYDADQRPQLLKEKNLPLFWSNTPAGQLNSYWTSFPKQVPDPKFFDPSDLGVACPKTGMPAYSVGKAEIAFELVDPGYDYYDFKDLKKSVPAYFDKKNKNGTYGEGPDKHVLKVTVSNPTREKITVPALRCIGDKVLWNNSVTIWIQDSGNKLMLNREKIEQKTDAVTLEPGKSISGMIDVLLAEGFPDMLMYGWGGTTVNGVVALGNASSPLIDFSAEPLLLWGTYNAHAKEVEVPLATTDHRMSKKEIDRRIKEEVRQWLK